MLARHAAPARHARPLARHAGRGKVAGFLRHAYWVPCNVGSLSAARATLGVADRVDRPADVLQDMTLVEDDLPLPVRPSPLRADRRDALRAPACRALHRT